MNFNDYPVFKLIVCSFGKRTLMKLRNLKHSSTYVFLVQILLFKTFRMEYSMLSRMNADVFIPFFAFAVPACYFYAFHQAKLSAFSFGHYMVIRKKINCIFSQLINGFLFDKPLKYAVFCPYFTDVFGEKSNEINLESS